MDIFPSSYLHTPSFIRLKQSKTTLVMSGTTYQMTQHMSQKIQILRSTDVRTSNLTLMYVQ